MGITDVIGLALTIFVSVLPTILARVNDARKERKHDTKALVDRDRAVLRAGLDRLRGKD